MNMETVRHSQILHSCQPQKTYYHQFHTCACCTVRLSVGCVTCCDFEQAYLKLPLSTGSRTKTKQSNDPLRNLQEGTTRGEDVYFIVWQLGHTVTVKAICCICHNLFLCFCLKVSVCPRKRGLNSEGTVQKQESR